MNCLGCRAPLEFYEQQSPPRCLRCEMFDRQGIAAFARVSEGHRFMTQRAAGRTQPLNLFQHAHAAKRAVAVLTAVRITGTTRYEYDVDMKDYLGQYSTNLLRAKAKDFWPRFDEETDAELRGLATKITPLT